MIDYLPFGAAILLLGATAFISVCRERPNTFCISMFSVGIAVLGGYVVNNVDIDQQVIPLTLANVFMGSAILMRARAHRMWEYVASGVAFVMGILHWFNSWMEIDSTLMNIAVSMSGLTIIFICVIVGLVHGQRTEDPSVSRIKRLKKLVDHERQRLIRPH